MKLKKAPNGKVMFLLKTGKDYVRGEMLETEALKLINAGYTKEDGKIIVDDKFTFMVDEDIPLKEVVKQETEKAVEEDRDMPLTKRKKR